jgi:hypothetical protein
MAAGQKSPPAIFGSADPRQKLGASGGRGRSRCLPGQPERYAAFSTFHPPRRVRSRSQARYHHHSESVDLLCWSRP